MRRAIAVAVVVGGCANARIPGGPGDVDADPGPIGGDCNDLPCDEIYVRTTGSDSAPGTKEAPVKTIANGIAKAGQANPKKAVFVQTGTYAESIVMYAGVSVYGGFDDSWTVSSAAPTTIRGASPAVTFDHIAVA